ncbi:hypothetical protein BFX80_15375 [Cobetia marina]|nr:hypothetical protein BFX80_15375 [Cobetia marina]
MLIWMSEQFIFIQFLGEVLRRSIAAARGSVNELRWAFPLSLMDLGMAIAEGGVSCRQCQCLHDDGTSWELP